MFGALVVDIAKCLRKSILWCVRHPGERGACEGGGLSPIAIFGACPEVGVRE